MSSLSHGHGQQSSNFLQQSRSKSKSFICPLSQQECIINSDLPTFLLLSKVYVKGIFFFDPLTPEMPFLMISVTSLQNKASCQNLSSFNKIGESGITSQFNHWNSCLTQKSLTSAATLVATAATEMWTAAKWRDQTGYFLSYHFNISVTSSIQNWWKKCTNHIKSTSRVEYRRTLIELFDICRIYCEQSRKDQNWG